MAAPPTGARFAISLKPWNSSVTKVAPAPPSSLTMVPRPWPSPMGGPPVGLLRFTKYVSLASNLVSPLTVTEMGIEIWPGAKVKVPDVAT